MTKVRNGEIALMGELFERHQHAIHSLLARLSRSDDAADDLLQETFLRALRYSHSWRGDSAFSTWLYRVAVNVFNDHWQRTSRELAATMPAIDGDSSSTEDERIDVLERALSRLEPERRTVLVLSRYHDMSFAEVARVLECTPAAARVRAHRALNELREIYAELERHQQQL